MTSIRTTLRNASARLAEAGVASPEHDARALAAHALGLAGPDDVALVEDLDADQAAAFEDLVSRRVQRVPLQHLLGRARFRDLELEVGPGVFVPQPETGPVVQWTVDALRGVPQPLCVDLCTGSGAIALALAHEVPGARVHAVELNPDSLVWTRRNVASRVAAGDPEVLLHQGDAEQALPELDGRLDLVVSNPPYVATGEAHIPTPEVLDHDPGVALWAGEDGLDVIRLVERAARRLLRPGGLLVVEHSSRQGATAPALLQATGGWNEVEDHRDDEGHDRFVTARWTPEG